MAEGLEALLRSAQAALSAASATLPSAEERRAEAAMAESSCWRPLEQGLWRRPLSVWQGIIIIFQMWMCGFYSMWSLGAHTPDTVQHTTQMAVLPAGGLKHEPRTSAPPHKYFYIREIGWCAVTNASEDTVRFRAKVTTLHSERHTSPSK